MPGAHASYLRRHDDIRPAATPRALLKPAVLFIVLCILAFVHPARAERDLTLGNRTVVVWEPAGGAKHPLLIFSHGFHGCATQSRFLMRAFAQAGYLVFAPNHRDAVCHGGKSHWFDLPDVSLLRPGTWTDASFRDRADDVSSVVAALRSDAAWSARIDWSRLVLAGHSLGGYTVLGLAGAWPSWRLPGVRAVLALSPYSQPFLAAGTLHLLAAPVMYQGGTLDFGISPAVDKVNGAYDQSPPPKYEVMFQGATHYAWTDLGLHDQRAIVAYALAFVAHALGSAPAPILRHAAPGVAELRAAER